MNPKMKLVKRVAKWVIVGVGGLVGLVLVVLAGALVALQTTWAQQRIAAIIADQANQTIKGRVQVTLDGGLSPVGFSRLSVVLLPQNVSDDAPLVELTNIQASWDLGALVKSLLGSGPLVVRINAVEAERTFVDLRSDAQGKLALLDAVALQQPAVETPEDTAPAPFVQLDRLDLFDVNVLLPQQPEAPTDAPDGGAPARTPATMDRIHVVFDMQEALSALVTVSSVAAPIPGRESVLFADVGAAVYLDEAGVPTAKAALDGSVEGLPLRVEGIYDAGNWSAHVDVDGSAEEWSSTGLGFEPTDPIRASVAAVGDLEHGDIDVALVAGAGVVAASVNVAFSPLVAQGALYVHGANPRTFAIGAPIGAVNLQSDFSVRGEPQSGQVRLAVRASQLEGDPIPDFDLDARAVGSTRAEFHLQGRDNSGLELTGHIDKQSDKWTFQLDGQAQRLPEHQRAPQLSAFDVRDLELAAQGQWQSENQTLDATLQLDVDSVRVPSAGLAVSKLSAKVITTGPLTSPALDGNITANAVRFGDASALDLKVQASSQTRGASKVVATTRVRASADAPPRNVTVSTTLTAFSPLIAKGSLLGVASKERAISVAVAEVHVGERTRVDGIRLSGAGELGATFALQGRALDVTAHMVELDLAALSHLFQPLVPQLTGTVTANVGLRRRGRQLASGHVFVRASNVGMEEVSLRHVGTSLVLEEDKLSGTVTASRGHSQVRVDAREIDVSLFGNAAALEAKDFRGYMVATVNADSRDFPELDRSTGDIHVAGTVQSQVIVQQWDDRPLTMQSVVNLRDMDVRKVEPRMLSNEGQLNPKTVAASTDPELAEPDVGWALTGLSASVTSVYDGATGKWSNSVQAGDSGSPNSGVTLALTTKLKLDDLNEKLATALPQLPLDGSLVIASTSLDSLPTGSFVPKGVNAFIEADIDVQGTVSSPRANGWLRVNDLRVSSANDAFPVSFSIEAKASKEAVEAAFTLTHDTLVLLEGKVDGAPAQNDWRAVATIDKLPLDRLPYVRDYGVAGSVSGKFSFDGRAASPLVEAEVVARDLEAYGEKMPTLSIKAKLADGKGELLADIRQEAGHAKIEALATSATAELADYRPTKVRFSSRQFQVRPLLVAMQDTVSDLSGVLDGAVDVAFDGGAIRATGDLALKDGLVLIPALGKQMHDIEVRLKAAPGKLELSRLDAKVERGLVRGKGAVTYDADGRLTAEVNLVLPKDRRLPIANKGRDIAEASGRIKLQARTGPNEETKLSVDVPELDVYFSDSVTDKVGDTKSPSFVALGTYLPDGHFVNYSTAQDAKGQAKKGPAAQSPANATVINVNLGKQVWLHHGTSTFAGIHGKIEARIGEAARLFGTLNLAEGRIDIQGRVFDIRPGSVTFRGLNPPNPDVVAEAAWASPSGHSIIATYRGSVANGKVVLRSEPPLSYGEILNVLLFDDPEGSGGSDGAPGAGDVAATVASAGLSQSLTSLTDLDIQANIETDAAGSPRPELGVRLTPRLAVEVAYVLEPSAALSQPPDKAFVSFDWRLSNAWSVEATLGDHGSAATDVTWKYRY
jgi:hypothetical protein